MTGGSLLIVGALRPLSEMFPDQTHQECLIFNFEVLVLCKLFQEAYSLLRDKCGVNST